jgi:ketosteroid isomerase-like protein
MARQTVHENVELARRGLEAFNRRDVPALMETCDPDVELFPLRALLEGTSYRGEDGLRKFFDDIAEEWTELKVDAQEFREVGDSVLTLGVLHARGRASGIEGVWPMAWVSDVRDGKVVRLRTYTDQQEALRVVGLAP